MPFWNTYKTVRGIVLTERQGIHQEAGTIPNYFKTDNCMKRFDFSYCLINMLLLK